MSANAKFVASIEALLAAAKGYNVEEPDHVTRVDMLGQLEALHYQLEDPAEAMFRQITNVREPCTERIRVMNMRSKLTEAVLRDIGHPDFAPNESPGEDTARG